MRLLTGAGTPLAFRTSTATLVFVTVVFNQGLIVIICGAVDHQSAACAVMARQDPSG
jgi:hypothetical protein